jgi:8-oxo-dGTP pyrophosphatase MutT (NUDIX family)
MDESKIERSFIKSPLIKKEHLNHEVRQVTCWIYTLDKKLVLVSKDKIRWGLPGGHPEDEETIEATCLREVREESGVDISKYRSDIKMMGYYLINETTNHNTVCYLQIRYVLKYPESSESIDIKPLEKEDEIRKILYADAFDLISAVELVPWMEGSLELVEFKKYVK